MVLSSVKGRVGGATLGGVNFVAAFSIVSLARGEKETAPCQHVLPYLACCRLSGHDPKREGGGPWVPPSSALSIRTSLRPADYDRAVNPLRPRSERQRREWRGCAALVILAGKPATNCGDKDAAGGEGYNVTADCQNTNGVALNIRAVRVQNQ